MLDFHPESLRTDVAAALEFLTSVSKRRCTAFVLSDFYVQQNFMQQLNIANRKHDVCAIQVYDRRAMELPKIGLMKVVDAETGYEQYVDTSSRMVRETYRRYWNERQRDLKEVFAKSGVDNISIATDDDYVKQLLLLFNRRNRS